MLPRKNGTYYAKESWLPGSAVAELGSLSFGGDVPEAQQMAEVRARVAAWLATKTETVDGATILLDSSYDPQTLDEGREVEYSKEETFLEDGAARVFAVLNRPLRVPNPFVWGDMYKAGGLAREAFEGEGNCVVRQLEALAHVCSNSERVQAWTREELEEELDRAKAELYDGEDSPYIDDDGDQLDWREVGVTGAMLAEICRRRRIPLNILWGNHVVERVAFETCGNGTSRLACHIRGDHAYFYGDSVARRDIAKLPVSIPRATPPATLKVRSAGSEGSIEDWTLLGEYEPGLEGHFYVVGSAAMLEARKRMHELRICPRVSLSGPCVQDVSKLTVHERGREDFVLHHVHPEHLACQAFLVHFAQQTGTEPLKYHGESPGAVLSSAFDALARIGKVRNVSQATRSEIFAAQTCLCADCGDRLTRFEVDHRTPLFLGGSNDRENLAAVCIPCHRAKCLSESQAHLTDPNPLTSRLNRETYQLFHLARKPPQMVAEVHPARPELKHPGVGRLPLHPHRIRARPAGIPRGQAPAPRRAMGAVPGGAEFRRERTSEACAEQPFRDLEHPNVLLLPPFRGRDARRRYGESREEDSHAWFCRHGRGVPAPRLRSPHGAPRLHQHAPHPPDLPFPGATHDGQDGLHPRAAVHSPAADLDPERRREHPTGTSPRQG
jgi:hypothetical protein